MPRRPRIKRNGEIKYYMKIKVEAIKKTQLREISKWKIQVSKQELQMQASTSDTRDEGI